VPFACGSGAAYLAALGRANNMLLIRNANAFFFAYLTISIGLLVAIETPFNEGVTESWQWLSLPIIALCITFTLRYEKNIRIHSRRPIRHIWFNTFLIASVIIFMSWPYALLLNSIIPNKTTSEIGGIITDKFTTNGRSRSFIITTWSEKLGKEFRFYLSEENYATADIGDRYTECFFVGSLGFLYHWRYSKEIPDCTNNDIKP